MRSKLSYQVSDQLKDSLKHYVHLKQKVAKKLIELALIKSIFLSILFLLSKIRFKFYFELKSIIIKLLLIYTFFIGVRIQFK
jgi:hypothetical protein